MNASKLVLDEKRISFINNRTSCLVLGGPGCGKTTMSLLRADSLIQNDHIASYQRVLFLSFARATISRVTEASQSLITTKIRKQLEINTYHGFCWSILQSHGYLTGLRRNLKLISPSDIAARVADMRTQSIPNSEIEQQVKDELVSLAFNEGIVAFDLFAELTGRLLSENSKLAHIICTRYPTIILDEFQDTNLSEWDVIQELGKKSVLVALADPDQRIYDFRGASPARIREFISLIEPETFDFGSENNRSVGTDITVFGNDVLTGANKGANYSDVQVLKWTFTFRSPTYIMKTKVIEAIRRLKTSGEDWSLAILVPSKRLMLTVSDALNNNENRLPSINHTVSIDAEGPTLAARIIALLLQPIKEYNFTFETFINSISQFYRGKGGNNPTATDLSQSKSFMKAFEKYVQNGKISNSSIIKPSNDLLQSIASLSFTGDPEKDWLTIRNMLQTSPCKRLNKIAEQARYIRLLNKGSLLREELAETWRRVGLYTNAIQIVDNAFIQEHFSSTLRQIKGIVVMNMHKAKGKEFDEVILYEDQYTGRYLPSRGNIDQARLNLRVSVTRAKKRTTILTPSADPSSLLF